MKVLKYILLAVIVLFLAYCGWMFTIPGEYNISRDIIIDAPREIVFDQVNNHKNRSNWSPWQKMDPDMETFFEGPPAGEGAVFKWSGNDSVGTGQLEIMESEPPRKIHSKLEFVTPWQFTSDVQWKFEESQEQLVSVTWTVTGSMPFLVRWMNYAMNETMGKVLQRGLNQLKLVAEKKADELELEAKHMVFGPKSILSITKSLSRKQFKDTNIIRTLIGQIKGYIKGKGYRQTDAPLTIYHTFNDKQVTVECAIPVDGNVIGQGDIIAGSVGGLVVYTDLKGPYYNLERAYGFLKNYIERQNVSPRGDPFEQYLVSPEDTPNPEEWLTRVYYPV